MAALGAGGVGVQALAAAFLDRHLDSPPVPSFAVPLNVPQPAVPRRVGDTDVYDIVQRPAAVPILPGRPATNLWTYNGQVPGPWIVQQQGRDVRVNQQNRLPVPVSVHLHGGDVPPDSDGHPLDLIQPGRSKQYFYPGLHAPANLWYHDHAIHDTGRNVYMGLAAHFTVTNDVEQELPLPKLPFDVPLTIQDKFFLSNGQIAYPRHGEEEPMRQGVFGDVILVNGTPKPFFKVARRRYRFRILNGSNARVYRLRLSNNQPFTVIQTEGGYVPAPIQVQEIEMAPSERISVVVDFGETRVGGSIVLRNVMGPVPGDPYDQARTRDVMRFDVSEEASDPSSVPGSLPVPSDLPNSADAAIERTFRFERTGGKWVINGKPWDASRFDAFPKLGTTEIWRLVNGGGGWWHPIHIHLIEFMILSRTGRPVQPFERGLKDTVLLRSNEEARVAMRWNHFTGNYVMHCHNVEHEDHDMMAQFRVV